MVAATQLLQLIAAPHAEERVTCEHGQLNCSAALARCSTFQLLQLSASPSMLQPFVADFRARFIALLTGAFRAFKPALALSILSPQLSFSEAETLSSIKEGLPVAKADGEPFSAYDLKRLQVGSPCCMMLELHVQRLMNTRLHTVQAKGGMCEVLAETQTKDEDSSANPSSRAHSGPLTKHSAKMAGMAAVQPNSTHSCCCRHTPTIWWTTISSWTCYPPWLGRFSHGSCRHPCRMHRLPSCSA